MTEKIQIQGPHRLRGLLQKPGADYCGPLVILMHGFMASKKMEPLKSIAAELERRGIASLRFDFDGHGQSEGRFRDMTVLTELDDARAVLDYVRGQDAFSCVALAGHSQGGVVAGMIAGERGTEIRALVQLSPAAVLKDDALQGVLMGKHYDPANPPDTLRVLLHRVGKGYFLAAQTLPIYEQSSRYKGPVLLIHGTQDRIVPCSYSEKYHQLYAQSRLHLYPGENHMLSKCRKEIVRETADFLCMHLKNNKE